MKIKNQFLGFFLSLCSFTALAQLNVSGKVTDSNGLPVIGANVIVSGKTTGTATDFDGNYKITVNEGDLLLFSSLGFKSKEIIVRSSILNVELQEDLDQLDEVVVTAFGIERKEKSLGYSVTEIEAEDVNFSGESNAFASLQGRVPGVQISRNSGASGGGVDILIRGISSINPGRDNQPLIIVDGVALNNDTFTGNVLPSAGSNSPSSSEQFSFSNRAADINPEDIESYNVLKGAAATALYGIRAANGAIVITTKKGKLGNAKVNITASTTFREVRKTPSLQTTYREGFSNLPITLYRPDLDTGFIDLGGTNFWSWGPKFTDDFATLRSGEVIDLRNDRFYDPYDLFRTGVNYQLNFNISGATDKLDYFFSAGHNEDEGILPNTDYGKSSFRFKAGYKATDNFRIESSIAYTKAGGIRATSGDKSVFSSLSYFSGTFPINDFENPDGSQRNYSFGFIDNPRYLLERSGLEDDVNRWVGNVKFNWNPVNWLTLNYTAQIDSYSDLRNRFVPPDVDVGSQVGGFILNQNINYRAIESYFLATATKDWSDSFNTELTLGHQVIDTERDYIEVRGETLNVPGINDISNTINPYNDRDLVKTRDVGVFGELKMSYLDQLFLTITGRNDWVSTLPVNKRSFFYPSVSLAWDVSPLIGDSEIVNFAKLRASWAEVGKGPLFGQTGSFFTPDLDFPFNGIGGFRKSTIIGDLSIEPEKNQSFEIGADVRLFSNRLRFDYAYYRTTSNDQIFTVGTAPSSGLAGIVRNAGDFESSGHEVLVSADIIKGVDFSWNVILNWSTNKGEVKRLPEDIESIIFADSGFAGVTSEVREGDELGTLYGYTWNYNDDGQLLIEDDGFPRVNLDDRVVVGNAFPDFIASVNNTLAWKGFELNALIEWKEGGELYDSSIRNSIRNGVPKSTEFRNQTTIIPGVLANGSPNTKEVEITQDYYRSSTIYNRASEIMVQDASWVKIRNVGLTYNFGKQITKTLNLDRLSLSLNAQNIIIWTPFDGFDPEGNQYSAASNVYGFTGLSVPLSESYSFGVNIGF